MGFFTLPTLLLLLHLNGVLSGPSDPQHPHHGMSRHQLDNWSSQFGGPLYEFSRSATKYNELQQRFQQGRDTSVEIIKLDQLINEVGVELGAYLEERVAVLVKSTSYAEQRANDYFTFPPSSTHSSNINYVSAKRSRDYFEKGVDSQWPHPVHLETGYEKRFGNVNVSTSTVHVPDGVGELDPALLREIDWTSDLDTNWMANYREHPTLYWQYYCSAAGFQRHFPGSPWPQPPTAPDDFDCRTLPSYLLSVSSRKSVVILLDRTQLAGQSRQIALRILSSILETLTENDHVALLPFSDSVTTSDCSAGMGRASAEYKQHLLDHARALKPGQIPNYQEAFGRGFELLQQPPSICNRALLLLTDSPPYDYGDLIQKLQTPHRPVRLFTYQIGRSASSRNMKRIACTNSGYYVQIQSTQEARSKVLKYLQVLSRPLVMQGTHSPQWSGVHLKQGHDYVITASMPVYDVRNTSDGKERLANFLGVTSIDISTLELKRLVNPFKIGVGGYGVLLENNGRVIMHPQWRAESPHWPVDITSLEQMDSSSPRNDSQLLEMRLEMLTEEHSYRPELRVRIPMDGFTRTTTRSHRYEYLKLKQTPYTLLLVSPTNINRFNGRLDPLRTMHDDPALDLVKILQGPDSKFSLNPAWVYCEYLNRNIGTKEEELIHFLRRMKATRTGWKWRNTGEGIKLRHGHTTSEEEVYRCDRDLVQSLLFDANVTEVFVDGRPVKYNKHESEIITMHGALLSFIMTRSGLTRWATLTSNSIQPPTVLATDSSLYQRSVDRYFIDPNSFTYTYTSPNLITATRALFVRKSGRSAPVAVVGVQFDHSKWARRFFDIAETCIEQRPCTSTCSSEDFDCYVLDENGYVLVSEEDKETGLFFGTVNAMVMEMLVNSDVYKRLRVYDYQGVCGAGGGGEVQYSSGRLLQGPGYLVGWVWARAVQLFEWYMFGGEATSASPAPAQNSTRPCTLEYDLYNYGESYNTWNFSYHGLLTKCAFNCDGYFNVHHIHRTNLILVVTDGKCKCSSGLNTTASSVEGIRVQSKCPQEEGRQAPSYYGDGCVDSNPEEKAMKEECGRGAPTAVVGLSNRILVLVLSLALLLLW